MIDWTGSSILIGPLALCALLALAIICERLWVLRMNVLTPLDRREHLYNSISEQGALEKLRSTYDNNPLQRMLVAALASESGGLVSMRDALRLEGELIAHELQRFLSLLGTLAMIAPLLGLLGTVLGLIQAFSAMLLDPSQVDLTPELSQGIAGALVTTAIGLFIAIPTVVCHRLLLRRVYSLVVELEKECLQLLTEYRGVHLRSA